MNLSFDTSLCSEQGLIYQPHRLQLSGGLKFQEVSFEEVSEVGTQTESTWVPAEQDLGLTMVFPR